MVLTAVTVYRKIDRSSLSTFVLSLFLQTYCDSFHLEHRHRIHLKASIESKMEVIRWGPKKRILATTTSCLSSRTPLVCYPQAGLVTRRNKTTRRNVSSGATFEAFTAQETESTTSNNTLPPLSIMPVPILLRSLMITQILASPRLLTACMPLMKIMASSQSLLMNPDRNPLLHTLMRKLLYDHFCAGENSKEVKQAVEQMRALGYKGVILGYAKEVEPSLLQEASQSDGSVDPIIEDWRVGTLRTLDMISESDFLAVKFTGAGASVIEALKSGAPMPEQFKKAMEEICEVAASRNTRMWIDAENQKYQDTIDAWTIDLMRKYNKRADGKAVVYNTLQAYLKGTPANILRHVKLASEEGWSLGIKLVRGAYIASEPRHLIHDTKEDTHACYDMCVANLLEQKFPGFDATISATPFPKVELFLATHNEASVKKACKIQRERVLSGQPVTPLGYGQLQGMADEISCELLQMCQNNPACSEADKEKFKEGLQAALNPHAFKYSSWGTVQECMQYLLRRAVENQGAIERTKQWAGAFRSELWRRMTSLGQ